MASTFKCVEGASGKTLEQAQAENSLADLQADWGQVMHLR